MQKEIVPPEIEGKNTDLDNSVELDTKEEALDTFKRACKRMLNPPVWHKLCGPASAEFVLMGDTAEEEHRLAKEGDYFRIDIPGPGPSSGDGYDWVRVELIEETSNPVQDEESCGMKVRASPKPGEEEGTESAHFFKGKATSSFIIRRNGNKVTASYHGRNELPNTDTAKISDKIRNSMVAMGAYAYLSELQWSALIKGFLEKEIGG